MTGEWQVRLHDEFAQDGVRLVIYRRLGDFVEVMRFDEYGNGIIERIDPVAQVDLSRCPVVPRDALPPLRDAIEPGPSRAELIRLEDALAVERKRVDRVLDRMMGSDD